jgi:hypothetical protein
MFFDGRCVGGGGGGGGGKLAGEGAPGRAVRGQGCACVLCSL